MIICHLCCKTHDESILYLFMMLNKKDFAGMLGSKIREVRLSRGITMEDLAYKAGIEYTQLSRIELGKINTTVYQIYVLSKILDEPLTSLLNCINMKEGFVKQLSR